jgi:cation diffusion facilitator CzcD-associated flavoprotein CzcO
MTARGIVAIVGAGPYGLSLAAHLAAQRVPHCIFGQPMRPWQDCMPPGMFLKSDGASSSLSHPDNEFPIERFYRETGRTFHLQVPISADTFVAYGQAFQRRYVPEVDTRDVAEISRDGSAYAVRLADGEVARVAKVVLAAGVVPFSYIPPCLSGFPEEFVT